MATLRHLATGCLLAGSIWACSGDTPLHTDATRSTRSLAASTTTPLVVFDDTPENAFQDGGWGTYSITETTSVHSGSTGVSLTPGNWDGIQFTAKTPINLSSSGYTSFSFWINGGSAGGQTLWAGATTTAGGTYRVLLSKYLPTGIPANTWTQVNVPFADIGVQSMSLQSIYVMDATGKAQPIVYFDDFYLLPAGITGASPLKTVAYDDKVERPFSNGSWGTYNLAETTYVHSGATGMALTPTNWSGVQFTLGSPINIATSGYTGFTFWVNGGSAGGQVLWVGATTAAGGTYRVFISKYLPNGVTANTWQQVTVPWSDLGVSAMQLQSIYIMDGKGSGQSTVYFDDIALVGLVTTNAPQTPAPGTTTGTTTGGTTTGTTTGGATTGGTTTGTTTAGTGTGATTAGGSTTGTTTSGTGTGGQPVGWLYTSGNRIYNSDGSLFHGRGANLADPRGCGACTGASLSSSTQEVMRRMDLLVDTWGANFIRLDLESYSTGSLGVLSDANYLAALQQIVAHLQTKTNVYMVMSVWVDPSLDANGWPTTTTDQILAKLATTFYNVPQVLFGISNEPQNNYDGSEDSTVWQRMNAAATSIRAAEAALGQNQHIVLAQGTGGWSRFLAYYETHPLTAGGGTNYAYEVHVYDAASTFQDRFITPSQTIPVIIGEFGPASGEMTTTDCATLMPQAEAAGVPWLAWTMHMRCPPNLLVDNSGGGCGVGMTLTPSSWGQQIMARLAKPWGSSQ